MTYRIKLRKIPRLVIKAPELLDFPNNTLGTNLQHSYCENMELYALL